MTRPAEHTPGFRVSLCDGRLYESDFGPCVAQVFFVEDRPPSDFNKRLAMFAASPALLEAAELGLSKAEEWIIDQLEGTSSFKAAMAELDPIRAALALARGGEV